MFFRIKPPPAQPNIEAKRFDGTNASELQAWSLGAFAIINGVGRILTRVGSVRVFTQDWVTKNAKGEFGVIKQADLFASFDPIYDGEPAEGIEYGSANRGNCIPFKHRVKV